MKIISMRDLRNNAATLRKELETAGEIVLTSNGRPFAVIASISQDMVEEEIAAIRRARVQSAISRVRTRSRAEGRDTLSLEEINRIIEQTRSAENATR